jgi:hypothetical protein
MRPYLLTTLGLFCIYAVAQTSVYSLSLRDETEGLLKERHNAAPGQPFNLNRLKQLHHAIMGGRPNVWAMPPNMLVPLQDQIEPLRGIAKELAQSARADDRFYGAILNSYLKQTNETHSLLLKLAHDEHKGTAETSIDTLFGLHLDTPELRRDLLNALQETSTTYSTLHSIALNNIGTWEVIEALPILMKILEDSAVNGGPVDRGIVRQIKALGPRAVAALPLLLQLRDKRRAAGDADFRELEDLDYAVLVVSGEYKSSVTGENNTSQSRSMLPPLPVQSRIPLTDTIKDPLSLKLWCIVVVLTVAVISFFWFIAKIIKIRK